MEELVLISILRAAWFLATLPFVIAWVRLPGFGWLQRAMSEFAKRGKMAANSMFWRIGMFVLGNNEFWGFGRYFSKKNLEMHQKPICCKNVQKLMVPHRIFYHFYAVGIFWTTTMLVAVWLYAIMKLASHAEYDVFSATTGQFHNSLTGKHVYNVWLSVFMLLLMEAQVIRRYFESLYVFKYSPSARLHTYGYIGGIVYYIAAPLSLCCSFAPEVFKFLKNVANDFIVNGKNPMLSNHKFNIGILVTPLLMLRWYAWLGAAIFLWGWVHQRRCHAILDKPTLRLLTLEWLCR
ncbi:3-oxo-5-alpha-steroid 4-dehydrogenase family protein [Artemisia annua]|uniref:3-oxo-5-alpha-steroid 4-dehydrogenase family protein n=1 Tax=Artemisia annua TaxID=35608 RepID=A0A2U1L6V4_ARTAN|nr:3-oxo-5-alpha-steroid 4-dehydrogenase family protein [Artemisia annua]